MSPPRTRFRVLEEGRWSAGGDAFIENAREAKENYDILRGDHFAVPILARNAPPRGRYPERPFVIAPQNAWVWTPIARGPKERLRVSGLRLATAMTYGLSAAVIRISEAIQAGATQPTSDVLHNVLDRGFEDAVNRRDRAFAVACEGAFVCVGTNYAYRDLLSLVKAHERYRSRGGDRRLVLMGPIGSRATERELMEAVHAAGSSVIRRRVSSRSQCLSAMEVAHAVVSPALVEASPVGVLEAAAVAKRVLLSDIVGHRGIVRTVAARGQPLFFRPGNVTELAAQLQVLDSDNMCGSWDTAIRTEASREVARQCWAKQLVAFLTDAADTLERDRERSRL